VSLFKLIAEFVTELVFDADGNATAKGLDDHNLAPTAGYHFGFYSRPKDGARGIVLKLGGEGNSSILVAFRDKQYEMTLEKGECGMQNAFEASILLDANGKITATAKAGANIQLTVSGAGKVDLGGASGDLVVTKKDLQSLYFAINAAVPIANDGGANLKTTLLSGLTTAGWTTGTTDGVLGSTIVRAKRS
jgi:hypothetical protein